jgi:hypothetical protein
MYMSRLDPIIRWTLSVSRETDIALRTWLAANGLRKGDLSRFVEEAVQERLARVQGLAPEDKSESSPPPPDAFSSPQTSADPELQSALEEWRRG